MRFMVMRKADPETEAGAMPSSQLIADMTTFHEEAAKASIVIGGAGLQPTSRGARRSRPRRPAQRSGLPLRFRS